MPGPPRSAGGPSWTNLEPRSGSGLPPPLSPAWRRAAREYTPWQQACAHSPNDSGRLSCTQLVHRRLCLSSPESLCSFCQSRVRPTASGRVAHRGSERSAGSVSSSACCCWWYRGCTRSSRGFASPEAPARSGRSVLHLPQVSRRSRLEIEGPADTAGPSLRAGGPSYTNLEPSPG